MRSRKLVRGRHSNEHVEAACGVAWFDPEQWRRLRQLAADPERLEESYEAWVAMAERAIRDLEATGVLIERVPVDTEELVAWCKGQGRPIDSSSGGVCSPPAAEATPIRIVRAAQQTAEAGGRGASATRTAFGHHEPWQYARPQLSGHP
jgi:hypothetical protein